MIKYERLATLHLRSRWDEQNPAVGRHPIPLLVAGIIAAHKAGVLAARYGISRTTIRDPAPFVVCSRSKCRNTAP